jgi:PAS domain S-box-containing protein
VKDEDKTKKALISELTELRNRLSQSERAGTLLDLSKMFLQEKEKRYRTFFEEAPIAYFSLDSDGYIKMSNQTASDFLGYTPEELTDTQMLDLCPRLSTGKMRELLSFVQGGKEIHGEELEMRRANDSQAYVRTWIKPIRDGGQIIGSRCAVIDVTDVKLAQEELTLAEQNFRNSLDNSPLGIHIVTASGKLLYANQTILDIFGYSSIEELKAVPLRRRFSPESYAEHKERVKRREQGELINNYDISIVRSDGEIRHLSVSRKAVVWNGEPQFLAMYQDITERKQAEQALQESEVKFRSLAENSPNMIFINKKGRIVYVNDRCVEVMGYTKEEFYSPDFNFLNLIEPQDIELVKASFGGHMKDEEVPPYEYMIVAKDGQQIAAINATKMIDYEGEPAILGVVTDITERKEAEEKIKHAAEEWKTTFDSISDFVSIHDKDFRIVRVNKALADLCNVHPKELIGRFCYEVFHGTACPHPGCPHRKTLGNGEPATSDFFEPSLNIFLELSTSPIFNDKGEISGSVHVARDITQRKKMEEQLIVADRLASIGELASGIAHELNNPLTSVIGFCELLLTKRDIPDDIRSDLKIINTNAQRTAGIVQNLTTFARKHPQETDSVNINSVIRTVLELRAYEQKVNNIKLKTLFASNLPNIWADSFQLQQVFINIIINAEYFMTDAKGEGNLTITTERRGDFVRTYISDDGSGISKENLGHIFDPFFTTKEVGKGTGLGLSICHGIVNSHGGKIYAESESGKGTTFVVELPITREGQNREIAK